MKGITLLSILVWFVAEAFSAGAPDPKELDQAFRNRREEASARKALEGYRRLSELQPETAEWWWRRAMACQFVGFRLEKDKEKRREMFREGRDAGKKATELMPDCAPCLFWQAINMALYGSETGIVKMIFTLGPIQDLLQKSAERDPTYAYAGAYRILGAIHEKVPGILGGSDRQARKYYNLAIQQVPSNPLNYWMLAKHWIDEMEEPDKAVGVIEKALSFPAPQPDDIESYEAFQELKEIAEKLKPLQAGAGDHAGKGPAVAK